ncbi:MAG: ribosome biogenesis GTPase Der [Phycisphaerae bacterium]|nr:ribosome biogenesis GTPase Der [Phycisphaerae bacterium]
MGLPVVAIVGRPNVGKSSLLNCLVGRRIAIVDPTAGVTRDRVSAPLAVGEGYVELVDTGGMGIADSGPVGDQVQQQIDYALASAAVILFVVDAREGLTGLDSAAARRLRKQDKPVVLAANKVDHESLAMQIGEFEALGFGGALAVSAKHARGTRDLLDAVAAALGPALAEAPRPTAVMKLAVVGKRNTGKSTFINTLAGEPRVIVSQTPGTTRDSIDVTIELDGRSFVLIDTAGVRKRKSLSGDIEFYSLHRALRSMRRADVVALTIYASVKLSQVDKDLAGQIAAQFKPVVLVVNKWDLARDRADAADYAEYLAKVFPELSYAPISLTSATEGLNVRQTIAFAEELFRQSRTRVPTPRLNQVIKEIVALRGPSHKAGTKPPRILYASQVAVAPPTIVCFVNDVRSFDAGYQRFLVNQLRQRLPTAEVPIRLLFRHRGSKPRGRPRPRSR